MGITVDSVKIKALVKDIFIASGLDSAASFTVADNLVQAEMRGIRSHGLVQVANYVRLIQQKKINAQPEISIIRESPSTLAIDADFAPGAVAGTFAMKKTIEKALNTGLAVATVKNATHFGFAAYYASLALPHNLIGLAFTSTGAVVAPFGGSEKQLGTNPICVAVPAGTHRPVIFDAATSNAAFNKIFFAYTEGRTIPSDWAITADGRPTENPADVIEHGGVLLPFGSYKGYGLSLIVQIITTLLSGTDVTTGSADDVTENTRKIAYNFMALDISHFTNPGDFKRNLDFTLDRLKNSKKRPDAEEIFIPGEIEFNLYEKSKEEGLVLFDGVEKSLSNVLDALGIQKKLSDAAR